MSEAKTPPDPAEPAAEPARLDLGDRAGLPFALELGADGPELVAPDGVTVGDMPILSESLRKMTMDEDALPKGTVLGSVFQPTGAAGPLGPLAARGLEVAVVALLPGDFGGELFRTPAFVVPATPVLIETWHGRGTLYLQNGVGRDVHDALLVPLEPGATVVAPPGWAYFVANAGGEPLVYAEYDSDKAQASSDALEASGGAAHYLLKGKKAGDSEPELNPKSRTVPIPRAVAPKDHPELGVTQGKPFLAAFAANPDAYRWLSEPGDYADALTALYAESGDGWL
jgi:oxalate decarboxylase/phosphoglucose isomerase-like protein (cupin superfamily)